MNSTVLAIRAITSTYASQLLWPVLWIGLAAYGVLWALVIWLATAVSPWWLLLEIVPTILFAAGIALWIIARILVGRVAPVMNAKQKSATKKFVQHLNKTAEHLGTPKFVLLYRIVKDAWMRPNSGRTFIGELAQTPGDMKHDFERLRSLF